MCNHTVWRKFRNSRYGVRFFMRARASNERRRPMNLAREFKIARLRLRLSQGEAARIWRVPLKALQNWEQGVRTPRAQTLLRLLPILFPHGFRKANSVHKKAGGGSPTAKPRPRLRLGTSQCVRKG